MKKSLFEPGVKESLIERAQKLQENQMPLWGTLTPSQMLRHLIESHKPATGEIQAKDRSNIFTRTIIRYFVLSGKVPSAKVAAKRKVQTFPEIDVVKTGIQVATLQEEKINFSKDLERLVSIQEFAERSPLFGKMTRSDWGYLFYSHANYHLSQFGV